MDSGTVRITDKATMLARIGALSVVPLGLSLLLTWSRAPNSTSLLLEDLVFVTEDNATYTDVGCDAVSVFSVWSQDPVHLGRQYVSPGRMVANSDFSIVIAQNSNSNLAPPEFKLMEPFLYVMRGDSRDRTQWSESVVTGAPFASLAAPSIMPDDDTLLISVTSESSVDNGGNQLVPPYRLHKYRLSEITNNRIGPSHGFLELDGLPVRIFPSSDGHAHVVTSESLIYTIDVASMQESAPRIALHPIATKSGTLAERMIRGHATISVDGRYIITNRGLAPELNVADLVGRMAWPVELPGLEFTGGVAINRGWRQRGLLAVHGGDQVRIYRLDPSQRDVAPELVGQRTVRLHPYRCYDQPMCGGPKFSLAWDTRGEHLIVASLMYMSEFQVIIVSDEGRSLVPRLWFMACDKDTGSVFTNAPNDILTANGVLPPPATPTPPPSPTPTEASTPTPTVIPSPTSTPTSTSTSTATATPTPGSIHLPIAVNDRCDPSRRPVDVVLVIDASTTMLRHTRAGRTKIEAAKEASRRFLDRMTFPNDQAALVMFNAEATVLSDLTSDKAELVRALEGIENREFTRIHLGLKAAHDLLLGARRRADHTPVVVLLTDGRSNPDPVALPLAAAAAIKADGILVYTIGLGDDVELDALRAMATRPEDFRHAPDGEDLGPIYEEIARLIPCPPSAYWP